ncbi:hypothetical protein BIY29_01265 [Brenneria alni]|uniref:Type III effector n=1 Tax=Brenneria alni TaxID=71656 RepID=A0A421DT79_9GAMM|nr:type III effector [Brenneria alni]RLM27742.1 hypothetical protein BIY29_01265 [Brenneria alni]
MVNPLHDRYFPGGRVVNPLANLAQEPVVKLHEAVSARTLGIGNYEGRHISVNSSTMAHLGLAQETLRKVKMMLPYGAGNQTAEVVYTGGESWARTKMARNVPLNNLISDALHFARCQAGNCSEMADLTYALLAQTRINAPVMRVNDTHWDHAYVLIGDPRDQSWGESNTVVVDPWVRYPSASTLAQAVNRTPKFSSYLSRSCNEAPVPEAQALNNIRHITTDEVERYLPSINSPAIGDELLEDLYIFRALDNMRDEKIVARDPSTLYSSPDHPASAMDDIAQATVDRQRAVQWAWSDSYYF